MIKSLFVMNVENRVKSLILSIAENVVIIICVKSV